MQDIPEPALQQRRRDIFRNFMTINGEGKASPLPPTHRLHAFWRLRFVHVLEEFVLRFGPYPAGLSDDREFGVYFPNPRSARRLAGLAAVAGRKFEDGKYLFKFGKSVHLWPMLSDGIVRIAPASTFADHQLNLAVRDVELEMEFWIHDPTPDKLRHYLGGTKWPVSHDGSAIWSRTAEDCWLYCLSATYDAAMYDDFDYNACLVIHKPVEFRDRLLWNAHKDLFARGHTFASVTYVDPLTQLINDVPIILQKNARHAYQDEVRAVWLPQRDGAAITTTFVKLGNLESIAELISLSGDFTEQPRSRP